jgi:hypothetical protein
LETKKLGKFMLIDRRFVTEAGKLTTEEVKTGTEELRPAQDDQETRDQPHNNRKPTPSKACSVINAAFRMTNNRDLRTNNIDYSRPGLVDDR